MLKDKIPPHNDEAEQAVLGALLLDNDVIDTVIQYVRAEDFYSNQNRRVFNAVISLFDKGQKADIITLVAELRQSGDLEGAGGASYVASLTSVVPSSANVEYYAKLVQDCSLRRSLLRVSVEAITLSYDESVESRQILEETQQKFFELGEDRQAVFYQNAKEFISKTIDHLEKLVRSKDEYSGIPSGFHDLDYLTSGFQASDLIIIGARPSIGKTALALNMFAHIAVSLKRPAAFFSLEMPSRAIGQRLITAEAMVEPQRIRTTLLKEKDYKPLWDAAGKFYEAPFYIADPPGMKLLDLRSQARRLRSQQKVEIIFVDYLTLIVSENYKVPRYEQIAEISRSLKSLARELEIPVVVLSQLRREAETREPNLSDIRESGSIEQDADLVLFLHREREGDEKKEHERQGQIEAKLIVAKNRNGPVGQVRLNFQPRFAKFTSLDRSHQ